MISTFYTVRTADGTEYCQYWDCPTDSLRDHDRPGHYMHRPHPYPAAENEKQEEPEWDCCE